MSYVRIPVDAGDFALLSSRVVKELRGLPERHRFLRGLRAWVGFTQQALRVDRGERAGGESKYSLIGLIRLASDGLFAFSTWPIRATMAIGGTAIVGASLFAAYAVGVRVVTGQVPVGFTSTIVVTVFLAGMNLFFMGVIGEYVGRIYDEVKQRPHYIVDRIYEVRSSDG
jgi:dolichol-phosphate mannosyltransferase